MYKISALIIPTLVLVSCTQTLLPTPNTTDTPTPIPTETPTPSPTDTPTPIPTETPDTPIPTETPIPPALHSLAIRPDSKAPDDSLPVPTLSVRMEDETSAYLRWGQEVVLAGMDGNAYKQGVQLKNYPNTVHGFYVRWGVEGGELNRYALTQYGNIQLQPLEKEKVYQAVVHSVGRNGNISKVSNKVTFRINTTRVDDLRKRMTGFFEDFNSPAGHFDELKWSTTFQTQKKVTDAPSANGEFINNQLHGHTLTTTSHPNGTSDRGWVMSRPRAVWDITGRTGELVFDLDHVGGSGRNVWYLNFISADQDPVIEGRNGNTSHVTIGNSEIGAPIQYLRILGSYTFGSAGFDFIYVDESGVGKNITKKKIHLEWDNPEANPLNLIPNYRRHFKLKMSKTHAELWLEGIKISEADLNLPSERLVPTWENFSYNTAKDYIRNSFQHWDNFGFDGPSSTTETHSYKSVLNDPGMVPANSSNKTVQIEIPDSVDGSTRQRLFFGASRQYTNSWEFKWNGDWKVIVNGKTLDVAKPKALEIAPAIESIYLGHLNTGQFAVEIPPGVLKTGLNIIDFSPIKEVSLLNIALEIDFKKGSAPSYTQPVDILAKGQNRSTVGMPKMDLPVCTYSFIEFKQAPHLVGDFSSETALIKKIELSGIVGIKAKIESRRSMFETGGTLGTKSVEIAVDDKVVASEKFDMTIPSPTETEVSLSFDSSTLSKGEHTLEFRCIGGDNKIGQPMKMYRDLERLVLPAILN